MSFSSRIDDIISSVVRVLFVLYFYSRTKREKSQECV
jgi:hypothetical protein